LGNASARHELDHFAWITLRGSIAGDQLRGSITAKPTSRSNRISRISKMPDLNWLQESFEP